MVRVLVFLLAASAAPLLAAAELPAVHLDGNYLEVEAYGGAVEWRR